MTTANTNPDRIETDRDGAPLAVWDYEGGPTPGERIPSRETAQKAADDAAWKAAQERIARGDF